MKVPTFDEIREALKVPDGRDYNNKNGNMLRFESIMREQQRYNDAILAARGFKWRRAGDRGKYDHA
jgi:hypothetical protein